MLNVLGEAALRTALLAAVVQCGLWLLRIRQPQLLLATWTIVLAASVMMPVLPRFTPLHLAVDPGLPATLIEGASDLLQQPPPQAPPDNAVVEVRTQPALGSWLEAVYVFGAFAIVLRLVLGVALSFRLLARAVPVRPEWAAGTHVRISHDITGPVTIAHVVLLPIDVVDWSDEMRRAVLAHERAHVARWDFAMLIVSQLNRALFWFSPLPWWLHRRLIALTELASDDQAMASTRDRLGYAEILLEMGRRSGPVSRGPAMARLSTLPQRINRILLHQALPCRASRPQQVMVTVGMAGLSFGVASLIPGPVSDPVMMLPAQQRDLQNARAIRPTPHEADVGNASESKAATEQVFLQEGSSTTALPPSGREVEAEPLSHSAAAFPSSAPMATTAAQPPRATAMLSPRLALRTSTTWTPALPPSRTTERPTEVAAGQGGRSDRAGIQAFSGKEVPLHETDGSNVATRTGRPTDNENRSPPSQQLAYGSVSSSLHSELERSVDSTCTGTVAVGKKAWWTSSDSSYLKPKVIAGQRVAAQAQFFRRANGTSWVRFNVFERPPLDLPVRLVRGRMTWVGEYGISYTVQAAGGNQLVGLAAPIAYDSARLELACIGSISHLF